MNQLIKFNGHKSEAISYGNNLISNMLREGKSFQATVLIVAELTESIVRFDADKNIATFEYVGI